MTTVNEATFARDTLRTYQVYAYLAERERDPIFKKTLEDLAETSKEQYDFWARKSGVRGDEVRVSRLRLLGYRFMRFFLGLTLTAKYLAGRKEERVTSYKTYCVTCTVESDHRSIDAFVDRMHSITERISETRATFFSNIILGLNDALIELTGALVGFSFALGDPRLVTVAGIVTGVAASMSMAASAYLQARHETGRNPFLAAVFTGVSYFVVVLLLVSPFLLLGEILPALLALGAIIFSIIVVVSFYSSVLLERSYRSQFLEMLLFSVVVGAVAFAIGHSLSLILPG